MKRRRGRIKKGEKNGRVEKLEGREREMKYKTARVQRITVLAYVSFCKGGDDIAKREKGLVYGFGFVQGQPLGISLVHLHKKTQYTTSEPKHCCLNNAAQTLLPKHCYPNTAAQTLLPKHCCPNTAAQTMLPKHCYPNTDDRVPPML